MHCEFYLHVHFQIRITNPMFFLDWDWEYKGYYYKPGPNRTSYEEANKYCKSINGTLAFRLVRKYGPANE